MDEGGENEGLSGWVWYQLGRMSAEHAAGMDHNAAVVRRIFSPPLPAFDPDFELLKANENIRAWMAHSDELKRTIARRDAAVTELRADMAALQERLDLAMKCYDSVSTDSHERLLKIQALEELVENLRKGGA